VTGSDFLRSAVSSVTAERTCGGVRIELNLCNSKEGIPKKNVISLSRPGTTGALPHNYMISLLSNLTSHPTTV
jgi:hypothetical protein